MVLAGLGVVALTHPGNGLTLVGVLFAAGSGLGWALYIFCRGCVGGLDSGLRRSCGLDVDCRALTLPFSIGETLNCSHIPTPSCACCSSPSWRSCSVLVPICKASATAALIAGVLLAFDPAAAFLIGWLLLSQSVSVWDFVGLGCVMVAGAAVTYGSRWARSAIEWVPIDSPIRKCQSPVLLPFAPLAVR